MLIGQHEGTVSAKNQIAFPKSFRDQLGAKLIVTKGLDGHLIVVSERNWKTLLEGTAGKPFTSSSARQTQRYLLGNASTVTVDSRGRFILAQHLKKYAGITSDVIFAGIDRFVEVWDKKRWEEQQDMLGRNVVGIADKLEHENT